MKTLTSRCTATFVALDLLFAPLIVLAALSLVSIEASSTAILVFAAFVAAKSAVGGLYLARRLLPYETYARATESSRRRQLVQAADTALQQLPRTFSLVYALCWGSFITLAFIATYALLPDVPVLPGAPYAIAMLFLALVLGSFAFAFPICVMITAGPAGQCSTFARDSGLALERSPSTLQVRIGAIALALGVGPTVWMTALGYMEQLTAQRARLQTQVEVAAADLQQSLQGVPRQAWGGLLQEHQGADQDGPLTLAVLDRKNQPAISSDDADGTLAVPGLLQELGRGRADRASGHFELLGSGHAAAYRALDEEYAVVAVASLSAGAASSFMLKAGIFSLLVTIWAPLCAIVLGRAASGPIQRLTEAARQIVEEGTQSEMDVLPVACNDEAGVLSERFNDLIGMMRDLSVAADAIANGNLTVTIDRRGELPDAFRRMLSSLQAIVRQIRETSVELASATTQILAASQEQEAAATSQSSAMEEISRTMDSLSQSAAHVSEAVQGVLSNAEQTFQNTDQMVERIGKLSSLAGRIGEILDVIKEIADRSDLLALNGSLEASRAGEEGHGFALVASEMRRLAERVTASVEDIKRLVVDIRESGSTTVMATEESKRLAEGTTDAARQITFVTQQQRSGTEQVSQSVRNIAEVVTQTVSATSQTRSSAQGLKVQAEQLSLLVQRFEISQAEASP